MLLLLRLSFAKGKARLLGRPKNQHVRQGCSLRALGRH